MADTDQTAVDTGTPTPAAVETTSAPQSVDIDGLSEFTWQGEKFTPDRWNQIYSEHKNLSEQRQAFAKEQEFAANLNADIELVLKDPDRLAQKFKELYPKHYHGVLDRVLGSRGPAPAQSTTAQPALPKEFLDEFHSMKNDLGLFKERAYQAEVQSASAHIDRVTKPLFEKFPHADEDAVFARAEAHVGSKQKLTDAVWERFIRESHEKHSKRADRLNDAKVREQLEKGKRGADTGPGGSAPGMAPKRARTIAEATEEHIQAMRAQ